MPKLLLVPEPCVICHELTLEAHRAVGQGKYYPGMPEEERERVRASITIVPSHDKCHDELYEQD